MKLLINFMTLLVSFQDVRYFKVSEDLILQILIGFAESSILSVCVCANKKFWQIESHTVPMKLSFLAYSYIEVLSKHKPKLLWEEAAMEHRVEYRYVCVCGLSALSVRVLLVSDIIT